MGASRAAGTADQGVHGRDLFRQLLIEELYVAYRTALPKGTKASPFADLGQALRANGRFQAMLDRMWPSLTASGLVRELLTNPLRLAEAADDLLASNDQQIVLRPRSASDRWTEDDLALLDEAEALLNGDVPTFGHVVVDEAQDLSPMQLRMVRRRSGQGSMTILGNLAGRGQLAQVGLPAHRELGDAGHHPAAPSRLRWRQQHTLVHCSSDDFGSSVERTAKLYPCQVIGRSGGTCPPGTAAWLLPPEIRSKCLRQAGGGPELTRPVW